MSTPPAAASGMPEQPRPAARTGEVAGTPVISRVLVSVLVLALGTAALRSAWLDPVAWVPLLGASLAGFGVIWLLRRAGINPAITTLSAFVVPLLLLAVLGRSPGESAWEGVTNAFPTLLTSAYPAPLTLQLLVPGLALAWAGGAIAGAGMNRRTFIVSPLIAAVVLLVAADLLTAGGSDRYGLIGLGVVTVLLAHGTGIPIKRTLSVSKKSLRHVQGTGTGTAASAGSGTIPLALLVGVFAMLVGFVPVGQPFQPRELIQPPATSIAEPNPLPLLGQWARSPEKEILWRSGDDHPVHLVVLPDYNGVSFDSQSVYVPLGRADEPVLPPGRFRKTVETAITWQTTSRWLPAAGVPTEASISGALVDVDTGSLISPEAPDGDVVSYTVRARVDAAHLAEISAADVGRHPRYTALPAIPPEFAGYAREVTKDADSYLQQAQALERAVKGGRAFDPNAPGGSSYGRLHQFLFEPIEGGGRRGTSEQFATAYAVLARSVGLPTRVVVGFGGGTPLPDDPDTNVVRGRDALAWPEVYFQDFGWVPFNPTPDLRTLDGHTDKRPAGQLAPAPTPQPSQPGLPPASASPIADWWWLVPLGVLLALSGSTIGLALARRSRITDHRARGAIGAWLLVEDALVLSGQLIATTEPAPKRAAALGIDEARHIAIAAENAAFAAAAHEDDGAQGSDWAAAGRVARSLRADSSWWRRWLWPINPAVWIRRPAG